MKYLWTTLQVSDMDEAIHFYEKYTGLCVQQRHPAGPGKEVAFLGCGEAAEAMIELLCVDNEQPAKRSDAVSIGFAVEDLDESLALAKEDNIPILEQPFSPEPGVRFFLLEGPDGVRVQLVERK